MVAVIGTVDNYTILPSPVLDDADPKATASSSGCR
jgi:hypothetical protein